MSARVKNFFAGVGGGERKRMAARNGAVGVQEGAGGPKSRKTNIEKISQCRKLSQSAENTLFHISIQ